MIARCDGFDAARKIKKAFITDKSQQTPLLNFIDMLEELLSIGDFGLFKEVKEKYDP